MTNDASVEHTAGAETRHIKNERHTQIQTVTSTTYQQRKMKRTSTTKSKQVNDEQQQETYTSTTKQQNEIGTTPDASKLVFINKGQEGLSYINTRNCSAGGGDDPLFMPPGEAR